jgi:hypothetical protein
MTGFGTQEQLEVQVMLMGQSEIQDIPEAH